MNRIVGYVSVDDDVADTERVVERMSAVAAEVSATYALEPGTSVEFVRLVDTLAPDRVPTPAFVDQARRNAELRWGILSEFGALDARQVHELAGSRSGNPRQTASRWQRERLIFAVEHKRRTLYPGFQFDAERRRPEPAVADVLRALPAGMRGWELASWWTGAADALQWRRPVDVLGTDPAGVVAAAAAEARAWALAAGEDVDAEA
jgi:hypothetical protein